MTQQDKQPLPRRKRSMKLTLAIMGAGAAATLAGCVPESPQRDTGITDVNFSEPKAYRDIDECVADNVYTEEACTAAFEASVESAPRFDSLAACEEAHGEGACTPPPEGQQAASGSGGGGWFMPAMMGYMVGNMMASRGDGASTRRIYHEPVYRTRNNRGDWSSASSEATSRVNQRNESVRSSIAQTNTARASNRREATAPRAATTQRATQRSGFGSRSSARGGFGS
ncbi:MAG: DUF1190 domain-containing protein [Halomonas sp.]|nr:DUF1190 domain-containing protein [Halomonas sp.]MDP3536323.1 DUF1190 domain-containing protein [Halomonas sp.]